MLRQRIHHIVMLTLLTALSWTGTAAAAANGPLHLFVSILPQKFIVQQIGKDRVSIAVMVPPGAGPATYEPKPAQMAALSTARIYFSIGVPFEQVWLPKITAANPEMKIVACDQGIIKRTMATQDQHGDHDHGHAVGNDPHIWLSPPLIKIMADTVRRTLIEADPFHATEFNHNFEAFTKTIDQLDLQIQDLLTGVRGTRFIVFHPSWGYFADTYGLEQIPIEVEGKEPKPSQLSHLIRIAREQQIKVVFVQPQFSTRTAQVIAKAIDGRVVTADPLAFDLTENLLHQARAFRQTLGEETKQ